MYVRMYICRVAMVGWTNGRIEGRKEMASANWSNCNNVTSIYKCKVNQTNEHDMTSGKGCIIMARK